MPNVRFHSIVALPLALSLMSGCRTEDSTGVGSAGQAGTNDIGPGSGGTVAANRGGNGPAMGGKSSTGGVTFAAGGTLSNGGNAMAVGGVPTVAGGTLSTGGKAMTAGGVPTVAGGTLSTGGKAMTAGGVPTVAGGTLSTGGKAMTAGGVPTVAGGTLSAAGKAMATGGISALAGGTSSTGGKAAAAGGVSTFGGAGGGSGSTAACNATSLVWRSANKTNYTSYPDPGSEECIKYNGCTWAGQFAACDSTKSEDWVAAHNIVSAFPDFAALRLHDLCLRKGSKLVVATVLDTCADSDCSGCCTQNKGSAEQLIDLESYTDARWGVPDGPIEWADLGPTTGQGCN